MGKRRKLIILIYHRVLSEFDYINPQQLGVAKFDWQMALLSARFNVLPLAEALECIESDSLPPRAVCITFDDGYADNYLNALPILQKYGLPATFFVVSGLVGKDRLWNDDIVESVRCFSDKILDLDFLSLGRHPVETQEQKFNVANKLMKTIKYLPDGQRNHICRELSSLIPNLPGSLMLTAEQIKKLSDFGMEIGSHSVTHPILKGLPLENWQSEILDSKLELERITGRPVRFFAFPNGKVEDDYTYEQSRFVKECGYSAALSTDWGCVTKKSDKWMLPRFTPWDNTPNRFLLRMAEMFLFG
jgi:peptidoglycan/xylan/chitin deacetylase (PgdA/CDA1 family)